MPTRRRLGALALLPLAAHAQDLATGHPAADYQRAAELWRAGQRTEAAYWFYRGQFRARVHLLARPDLPPSGDRAAFGALNETLGRPINEWLFGSIPEALAVMDRVLAWHAAEDDPFTPKAGFPAAHAATRAGLAQLRARTAAEADAIRRQRAANGLPNR